MSGKFQLAGSAINFPTQLLNTLYIYLIMFCLPVLKNRVNTVLLNSLLKPLAFLCGLDKIERVQKVLIPKLQTDGRFYNQLTVGLSDTKISK